MPHGGMGEQGVAQVTAYSDLPEAAPAPEKDEVLDVAEKAGFENLKERLATGDVLLAQANTLLSLLLAGIGGALAMGRTVFDDAPSPIHVWGAASVAAYWSIVAVLLVARCIMTRQTQVLYNEPRNLYRPESGWSVLKLRRAELGLLQARIQATKTRNSLVAWWLDRCRIASALAPVVFAATAVAVQAYR